MKIWSLPSSIFLEVSNWMPFSIQTPIPHIEPDVAGEWGRDRSAPEDDGWGWIRSANSLSPPFKTKGSWNFARRTLSYTKPAPRIEAAVSTQRIYCGCDLSCPISSLVVLSAKQVSAHLTEEDAMKFTSLHVHLIRNMGANKMKKDKEMGTKSPHPISPQKKGKGKAIENAEKFTLEESHS